MITVILKNTNSLQISIILIDVTSYFSKHCEDGNQHSGKENITNNTLVRKRCNLVDTHWHSPCTRDLQK